jgi:cytochrome c
MATCCRSTGPKEGVSCLYKMAVDRNSGRRQARWRRYKEPGRAADLDNGAKVFADTCASCHGKDGLGKRAEKGSG